MSLMPLIIFLWRQLLADAASIDWSFMYALDDLYAEFEIFNFLIALYECNVPSVERTIYPRHKPWIGQGQRLLMASRDRSYDILRKNKFSVIVHHYLSDFVNKRRSAKNSCESALWILR
jgi:hypothetical protein